MFSKALMKELFPQLNSPMTLRLRQSSFCLVRMRSICCVSCICSSFFQEYLSSISEAKVMFSSICATSRTVLQNEALFSLLIS